MNSKKISLMFGVMFVLFLAISLVSSASLTVDPATITFPTSIEHDAGSFEVSFELTNAGTEEDIDWSGSTSSNGATFTSFSVSHIGDGTTTDVVITVTATVSFDEHKTGSFSGSVIGDPTGPPSANAVVPFSVSINSKPELSLIANADDTVTVRNEGNTVLDIVLNESSDFGVSLSRFTISNLAAGNEEIVDLIIPETVGFDFGNNLIVIGGTGTFGSNSVSDTATFSVEQAFCRAGRVGGNLEITDVKVDNDGEGKDDEWLLLDIIEIEVQVDNNGDDDIDDVFVEIALYDSDGNNQVNDLDFENSDEEEFDVGRIKDGKDETVTFVFRIPADVEDGSYKLAVKAYSDDLGEDIECTDISGDLSDDIFEDISIDREDDEGKFIAFENIVLTPSTATCNEVVTLTADIFNIGDEDQEQVKINLFNTQLGLSDSIEIRNDLDQGDDDSVNFDFVIPADTQDGTFQLRLSSEYDYKNGNYRESSDDDRVVLLSVLGCSGSVGGTGIGTGSSGTNFAAITASLQSDAEAGEELVVRTTITNLGSNSATFIVDVQDFESWADLDSVSSRVLSMGAGESREITLRFNVDDDADGSESFIIEVSSGTDIEVREVSVNVGSGSGSGITGATIGFGDNAYLWIIGIINVILVVLIIVVAVRISRR